MTKNEIVESTLRAMRRQDQELPAPETLSPDDSDYYEEIVIPELTNRIPGGDIKTCEDFNYLNAECCETCHTLYPHYEMHLESLPDASVAWICCSVRRKLLNLDSNPEYLRELAALKEFLGGDLSKRPDPEEPEANLTQEDGSTKDDL